MSEYTTQDTEVSSDAAKPAKKAAKKAAAKKAAAKKVAAKKTAAKKSAKAAEVAPVQAVFQLDEAPAAKPKAVKVAKKAAKKK